jgi:hypothetical protein
MIIGTVEKQPADRVDRDIVPSKWLANRLGDYIVSAEAFVDQPELVVEEPYVEDDKVKLWFSAGVSGYTYKVTLTFHTYMGRTKQVEIRVRVKDT